MRKKKKKKEEESHARRPKGAAVTKHQKVAQKGTGGFE